MGVRRSLGRMQPEIPAALVLGFLTLAGTAAAAPAPLRRPLSLHERIVFQAAVEEVHHRHRIWPKENPEPKPRFEEVLPPHLLRAKVEDDLRKSSALERYWNRRLRDVEIQAEMERMARDTRDPVVLSELFAALGNDPHAIAECLARPTLADRLIRGLYAWDDRFHGALRAAAERDLARARSVEELRATSGTYQELELSRSDRTRARREHPDGGAIPLTSEEWSAWTLRLPAEVGRVSELEEDETRFFVTAVISRTAERMRVATLSWSKPTFDAWWENVRPELPADIVEPPAGSYRTPSRTAGATCSRDTWRRTASATPRCVHTAVWTGSEMIVWGGMGPDGQLDTGGRYDPATDSWVPMATAAAPEGRQEHTAVWTGREMIVWGGMSRTGNVATGGRYDPTTDSWRPTNTANVPFGRRRHTAIWTGIEMIVWGGPGGGTTGGRYDPSTDSWVATSTGASVPSVRDGHSAVWTGTEMIVWGGFGSSGHLKTGGRYNPSTDTWQPTSTGAGVPTIRYHHTAVWTGTEMIVWGGVNYAGMPRAGGRYDPTTDSWVRTSTGANAPTARGAHTAIWTGGEMIVWGGVDVNGSALRTGGRYDPATDTWRETSKGVNVPGGRYFHTAVWTGQEMVVYGGRTPASYFINTGGRYDAATDSWLPMSPQAQVPEARDGHTAMWTGAEMIVWGGFADYADFDTGGRYTPATDSWTPTSTGANVPSARSGHVAVWTGSEMIVWGGSGYPYSVPVDGGRYDPARDAWMPTSTGANVPAPRVGHTAVWTGSEMIVWGGADGTFLNTGARYSPSSDTWVPTSTVASVPSVRWNHTAVWTSNEMIVWGGWDGSDRLDTGGRYSPSTDSWLPTSRGANVPAARWGHTVVWTGSEMIVWGGSGSYGGRYDPTRDSWRPMSSATPPQGGTGHTAVWTGEEMIVWGGGSYGTNTGGRYDPSRNSWVATSTGENVPVPRTNHAAVWTGSEMIVWGGWEDSYLETGGLYCPDGVRRVDYVVGQGLGPPNPNEVKVVTASGVPVIDFLAYGAGQWGVNVAGADVELGPFQGMLTGPGPGAVFGPHVRAFRRDGTPIGKVSFYAYGTLRYGVNVAAGNTDGDAYDEILTGAGPGGIFGPHVRGFDYDGTALTADPRVSFFAYGTLRFGVNVSSGGLDLDAWDEILTGAGPSPAFPSTVRGFDVNGGSVAPIAKIDFVAFPYPGHGAAISGGDVDGDAYDEIVATPGPGPAHPARILGMNYDGASVGPLAGFDVTPFPTLYGGRSGVGDVTNDGRQDLVCGAGRDAAADASVLAFAYGGTLTRVPGTPFNPFPGRAFGVNVAASETGY